MADTKDESEMPEGEIITLSCADDEEIHQIWDQVDKLRSSGLLCDGVLTVKNKKFPVHKVILAANSDYFRSLFANESNESRACDIEVSGVDLDVMNLILEYVYTRKVEITMENVFNVLPVADLFHLDGLTRACCALLISELRPNNCIGIMKYGEKSGKSDLAETARKYVLDNFQQVATGSKEFLDLSVGSLADIVGDDCLTTRTEEDVYEAIMRWVDYAAAERVAAVPSLLPRVRMGLVRPTYFLDNIGGHLYVKDNPGCAELIKRSWEFLYNLRRFGVKDIRLDSPLVRPRIPRDVLFAIGGWSGGAPVPFFETYDCRSDRWYTQPSLEDATPRAYHGLAVVGHIVYIIGGFDGSQYYSSVRTFDPVSQTWDTVAPMHVQRCYVSTAVVEGAVYACGGYDGRWRLNIAERYDPATNQWSMLPPMCSRRSDAGAHSLNGRVYVAGGFDGERCLNNVDVFDPAVGQWSLVTSVMTSRRSGVATIAYQNILYCFGGFNGESRLSSAERYCPETNRWSPLPSMFATRSNFAVVLLDGLIFVIGGFNGSHTIPHVECFDPERHEWYDATDMNVNRSALKACVISDLPNVTEYTFYGEERRRQQDDLSGDSNRKSPHSVERCQAELDLPSLV